MIEKAVGAGVADTFDLPSKITNFSFSQNERAIVMYSKEYILFGNLPSQIDSLKHEKNG